MLHWQMRSLMELFDGGNLEHKIMQRCECINYATTPWESVKPNVFERRVSYKFNRSVSVFSGDVTCIQQKIPIENTGGWIINEVMTLHGVPFADHFRVRITQLFHFFIIGLVFIFIYIHLCISS